MPPIIPGEPRYLSNSQIELLLECSWKHKLKYIDDLKEPVNDNLIVGSAVHKAVEVYRYAQLSGQIKEWTTDHMLNLVHIELDMEFDRLVHEAEHGSEKDGVVLPPPGMIWTRGIHKDNARKLAHKMVEAYFQKTAECDFDTGVKGPLALQDFPVSIEQEFYVPIPGTNDWYARGRFDMRTKTSLVDLKTAKMRYSQRDMNKKTQPSFYIFALHQMTGEFLPEFRYHIIIKPTQSSWNPSSGDPPPESMSAYRTAVQRTMRQKIEIDWFAEYLRRQIRQIELGAQVPRQNADFCDFCGVAAACKPWLAKPIDDDPFLGLAD